MCSNMDDSQEHCAKWEKPDTKGHVMYDATYVEYKVNPQRQIGGCEGVRGRGELGFHGCGISFWGDKCPGPR